LQMEENLTESKPTEEKYDQGWFKRRAFESLKKIGPNTWDYSDSLLLYLPTSVDSYESLQEADTPYNRLVTTPERQYLESIAPEVVALLPQKFEYVDLGPGTEHKEQFFFDEARKQGKEFTYIPVDISQHYLSLAESHAGGQGIPVRAMQCSFEELADELGESETPRFVSIGLTFSNFEPQHILDLLKRIAGKNGFVFINAQMRDRVDMAALQEVYQEDGVTLADDKLKLVGLDPDTDVTERRANDRVEVWGEVINLSERLKDLAMQPGDKILLFQSLRYTKEQLEEELKKSGGNYTLFDTGESFIAAVIQN
jgi:hypothetical protein